MTNSILPTLFQLPHLREEIRYFVVITIFGGSIQLSGFDHSNNAICKVETNDPWIIDGSLSNSNDHLRILSHVFALRQNLSWHRVPHGLTTTTTTTTTIKIYFLTLKVIATITTILIYIFVYYIKYHI